MEQPSSPPPKDPMIDIYVGADPIPYKARRDVCISRSAWMKAVTEQEQWVHLEGLDVKVSNALIAYFQLNSIPMLNLRKTDRDMLIKIFELNDLEQEYERAELKAQARTGYADTTQSRDDEIE